MPYRSCQFINIKYTHRHSETLSLRLSCCAGFVLYVCVCVYMLVSQLFIFLNALSPYPFAGENYIISIYTLYYPYNSV